MRLPPSVLTSLRAADPATWPGIIAVDAGVRAQVERALTAASPGLADVLIARLERSSDWDGVRATLWTDRLAVRAGARFVGTSHGPCLRYSTPEGPSVTVAPLSFRTSHYLGGEDVTIARVVASLETVLLPHRFAVYLRKPLPDTADSARVVAAAYGWIRDAERGQAPRFTSFDDDEGGIHLDLDLLPEDAAGDPGAWFVVAPSRGAEWLGLIDQRLGALLAAHSGDDPLIPVLCAAPRWNLGRGYPCQWLYGTPREVHVTPDRSAKILWPPSESGFFSDPATRRITAVWWLECAGTSLLTARGWGHDNPNADPIAFTFPGARLGRHDDSEALSWDTPPPTTWEGP